MAPHRARSARRRHRPRPCNPLHTLEGLGEIAESIRAHGLLQPTDMIEPASLALRRRAARLLRSAELCADSQDMLGHLLDRLRRWFEYTNTTGRDEGASAAPETLPAGAAPSLIEDCRHRGPGVYYLYVRGEVRPVYVGMARDVRHRLRKHRYNLQNGWYPENPPVHDVSYIVQPTITEAEARRVERAEIRALRPRWNGTGMSETHVRQRKQAAAEQQAARLTDQA